MRLVVIESPYAGDVDRNLSYLRAAMHDCFQRGEAPFASHALYTQPGVLDDGDQAQRSLGMKAGFGWSARADAVVVYTDLGISDGMKRGIEAASRHGRPIEFRSLPSSAAEKEKVRCDASCRHADPFGPWPHETRLEEDTGEVHTDDCIEVCQEHGDDDVQHCTSGQPDSKCRVRTPAKEGARRAREIAESVQRLPSEGT